MCVSKDFDTLVSRQRQDVKCAASRVFAHKSKLQVTFYNTSVRKDELNRLIQEYKSYKNKKG